VKRLVALAAILATVIGVVTWATARSVRRYEADLDYRNALAVIDEAERVVKVEQSRLNHPSNRGNQ
jgi:hypothetical protein